MRTLRKSVTVYYTHRCNLACPYCFEADHEDNREISSETLAAALDFAFKGTERPAFNIFGGEPFLCWDRILQTLECAHKHGRLQIEIMTNGTLITDEMISQLAIYKDHLDILLSVDHFDSVKDCRRVLPTAQKLLDAGIFVHGQYTIFPGNIDGMFEAAQEIFKVLPQCNFKRVCEAWDFTDENVERLYEESIRVYELARELGKKAILPGKVLTQNVHCGEKMRDNNSMAIDVDGKIYICEQAAEQKKYCMGDVWKGLSFDPAALACVPGSKTNCCLRGYAGHAAFDAMIQRLEEYLAFRDVQGTTDNLFDLYMTFSHAVAQLGLKKLCMKLTIQNPFRVDKLREFLSLIDEDVKEFGVDLDMQVDDHARVLQ